MPAIDDCQPQIVHALEKDNWRIAIRQYAIYAPGRRNPLYADLLAKRGERQIIILEVKCFADNVVNELYTSIGQYLIYRSLLRLAGKSDLLYLVVPSHAYRDIVNTFAADVIVECRIKLLVVNLEKESIEQWINP